MQSVARSVHSIASIRSTQSKQSTKSKESTQSTHSITSSVSHLWGTSHASLDSLRSVPASISIQSHPLHQSLVTRASTYDMTVPRNDNNNKTTTAAATTIKRATIGRRGSLQVTTTSSILPTTNSIDNNSMESLLAATAPMVGLSDSWKEDLERHQLNYMTSLTDPGVFTAELLRKKEQQRRLRENEKQARIHIGAVPNQISLGDLLSITNTNIKPTTLSQICRNLLPNSGATLCELCLDSSNITDTHLQEIAMSLERNQYLTSLSLSNNHITSLGIVSLAKILRKSETTPLRNLILSSNNIGDRGVAALSAILHETELRTIDFTSVGAGDIGAKHLALALSVKRERKNKRPGERSQLPIFPVLSYGGNKLTPNGLLYFVSCIVQNKTICNLNLDGNVHLGDQAGAILADLLRCYSSLTLLSVQNIGLTRDGMAKLFTACDESETVRTLKVGSNKIDDLQQLAIDANKFQISQLSMIAMEESL